MAIFMAPETRNGFLAPIKVLMERNSAGCNLGVQRYDMDTLR